MKALHTIAIAGLLLGALTLRPAPTEASAISSETMLQRTKDILSDNGYIAGKADVGATPQKRLPAWSLSLDGCAKPALIVPVVYDVLDNVRLVLTAMSLNLRGYEKRVHYLDRTWDDLDRYSLQWTRFNLSVRSTLRESKFTPYPAFIITAAPAGCHWPEGMNWKDAWLNKSQNSGTRP